VPKGCIQTYVENAIKHGLSTRTQGGMITIEINRFQRNIQITIRDNGVGRAQAALKASPTTGKGLNLMHQYYDILNRNNVEKIIEKISDLIDNNGNPAGTEVRISIPEQFDFSAYQIKQADKK
jgi:LytS/YehU family sensor histidine kinase